MAAFQADEGQTLRDLRQARQQTLGEYTSAVAIRHEFATRPAVSEACDRFADDGHWAVLPAEQQLLVYERLQEATELLSLVQLATDYHHEPPLQIGPNASRRTVIGFLLVDYWSLLASKRWIARLLHPES